MTSPDDAVIVVVGAHTHIGARIAERLEARGRQVVALGDEAGEGVDARLRAIERGAGGRRVTGVLHAEIEPGLCTEVTLERLTPKEWQQRCARPIDSALWTARAAFTVMATGDGRPGTGGVLGFVCPSLALTGATGQVALSTTSEAIRLLAKSAARRWGRFGILSNAFAPGLDACVPPALSTPHDDEGNRGLQVHATALDLDDVDPADDIASLVIYLAGPGAAGLTGATFGTDGGELMAP